MTPKYSIILPVKNALIYAKDCINSVISQNYNNYELLVCDNCSEDGLRDYVEKLNHSNIKYFRTNEPISMVDNFELSLSRATGEWVMFLGADDGLMPFFFQFADFLTQKAIENNIRIINSSRSYFFWKGCQDAYGSCAIDFNADACLYIKETKTELMCALLGDKNYIDIAQMYSNSIVHSTLIKDIKTKQKGYFYTGISPDAAGAASLNFYESRFLETKIPLGWIGSSPKSNGFVYQHNQEKFKNEYSTNLISQCIKFSEKLGIFGLGIKKDNTIKHFKTYLYDAVLHVCPFYGCFYKLFFNSKFFMMFFLASIWYEYIYIYPNETEMKNLRLIAKKNHIPFFAIKFTGKHFCKKMRNFFTNKVRKNEKTNEFSEKHNLSFRLEYSEDVNYLSLSDACRIIDKLDKENHFIETYIRQNM